MLTAALKSDEQIASRRRASSDPQRIQLERQASNSIAGRRVTTDPRLFEIPSPLANFERVPQQTNPAVQIEPDNETPSQAGGNDILEAGTITVNGAQHNWEVRKAGQKKSFRIAPSTDEPNAVEEIINGVDTYRVSPESVDLYYNRTTFLRLNPSGDRYEKELHYPLPNRLFGAGHAAGLRTGRHHPDLHLTMGFFDAVVEDVEGYDPSKRTVTMRDGSTIPIFDLITDRERWASGSASTARFLKDLEALLFAGASFSSKRAKLLGTMVTAAHIGVGWSPIAPTVGTSIIKAWHGSAKKAGTEYGSKTPEGAIRKASIVGAFTRIGAAIFSAFRMDAMANDRRGKQLLIQLASTVILSTLSFSLSFAWGLATAIEAFGIGIGMGFIPFLSNLLLSYVIFPAVEKRFRHGRKLSPYIVNLFTILAQYLAFRVTKAFTIAGNKNSWDFMSTEFQQTLESQLVQQTAVEMLFVIRSTVALEAGAYNRDTAPIRNYYADNHRGDLSRYDRIYDRGITMDQFRRRRDPVAEEIVEREQLQ